MNNDSTIREWDLLRAAEDWLVDRTLDAPTLRHLAQTRSLDFATAALYQWLRQSTRHGPMIAALELPASPPSVDFDILIVPGAFYKEKPETGADGGIVRESARRLGIHVETVPLLSFGTV